MDTGEMSRLEISRQKQSWFHDQLLEAVLEVCRKGHMYRKRVKIEGTVSIVCDDSDVIVAHITESVLGRFNIGAEETLNRYRRDEDGSRRFVPDSGESSRKIAESMQTIFNIENHKRNPLCKQEKLNSPEIAVSVNGTMPNLSRKPTEVVFSRSSSLVNNLGRTLETRPFPRKGSNVTSPVRQINNISISKHQLNGSRDTPRNEKKFKMSPPLNKSDSMVGIPNDQRNENPDTERRSAFHIPLLVDGSNHVATPDGAQVGTSPKMATTSISRHPHINSTHGQPLSPDKGYPSHCGPVIGKGIISTANNGQHVLGDLSHIRPLYQLNSAQRYDVRDNNNNAGDPGHLKKGHPEMRNLRPLPVDAYSKSSPSSVNNFNIPAPYIQMNSFYVKKDDITLDQYINSKSIHPDIFNIPTHKCPYCERIFATSTKLWKHIRRENCNSKSYLLDTPPELVSEDPTLRINDKASQENAHKSEKMHKNEPLPKVYYGDPMLSKVKTEVESEIIDEYKSGKETKGTFPLTNNAPEHHFGLDLTNGAIPFNPCLPFPSKSVPSIRHNDSNGNVTEIGGDVTPQRKPPPEQNRVDDISEKKSHVAETTVQETLPGALADDIQNEATSKSDGTSCGTVTNGHARKTKVCQRCKKRFTDITSLLRHKVLKHSMRTRRVLVTQAQ